MDVPALRQAVYPADERATLCAHRRTSEAVGALRVGQRTRALLPVPHLDGSAQDGVSRVDRAALRGGALQPPAPEDADARKARQGAKSHRTEATDQGDGKQMKPHKRKSLEYKPTRYTCYCDGTDKPPHKPHPMNTKQEKKR